MAIKINQKIEGIAEKRPRHTTKDEKNSIQSKAHKKAQKSHILGSYEKKCHFHFPKMFCITFSEGNGRAEVKENNSNDTLVCDDDAHIVVLCTSSDFFCTVWDLTEVQKKI